MFSQDAGDGVEKATSVGAADGEKPALGFVVGGEADSGGDGEALDAAGDSRFGGRGQWLLRSERAW